MSFDSSPESQALVTRPTPFRPEILAAYDSAVRDINQQVTNSVQHLRGEISDWATSFNQKVDVSINELRSAVGREIRTTNNELELRVLQKQGQFHHALEDHVHTTQASLTKQDTLMTTMRDTISQQNRQNHKLDAKIETSSTLILDEMKRSIDDEQATIRKELTESHTSLQQRAQQNETNIGQVTAANEEIRTRIAPYDDKFGQTDQQLNSINTRIDNLDPILTNKIEAVTLNFELVRTEHKELETFVKNLAIDDHLKKIDTRLQKLETIPEPPPPRQTPPKEPKPPVEGGASPPQITPQPTISTDSANDDDTSFIYSVGRGEMAVHDPLTVIELAKGFWFRALSYFDLHDHSGRTMKNLGNLLNSNLLHLEFASDPDLWTKLHRIQTALRADMSPYHAWPQRIVHLLNGEFTGIARRIEDQQPTWISMISWIGDKDGVLNQSYNSYLRLHEFSSQVENTDGPREIIMKLYTIAYAIPPNMMSTKLAIDTVKAQPHRYTPTVYDRMMSYHRHEEHTPGTWLESLVNLPNRGFDLGSRRNPAPLDVVRIPRPPVSSPLNNQPIETDVFHNTHTINAVQATDTCRTCGKRGHWARDCRISNSRRHYKNKF